MSFDYGGRTVLARERRAGIFDPERRRVVLAEAIISADQSLIRNLTAADLRLLLS